MATLLKIQSSIFQGEGKSSALAEEYTQRWLAQHPGGRVVTRDLTAEPVPHLDLARFQAFLTPEGERSADQQAVVDYSDALIRELLEADTVVLTVPMYNFSVPSTLRAYFDHIARAGITFRYTAEGPEGLVKGKQAVVIATRGGYHGGAEHTQTAFVREFLAFIGITDIDLVLAEGFAISEEAGAAALDAAREQIRELVPAQQRDAELARKERSFT